MKKVVFMLVAAVLLIPAFAQSPDWPVMLVTLEGPNRQLGCITEDELGGPWYTNGDIPANSTVILQPEFFLCDVSTPAGGPGNTVLVANLFAGNGKRAYDGLEIHLLGPGNYYDTVPMDHISVPFRGYRTAAVAGTHNAAGQHGWATTGIGAGSGGHYIAYVVNRTSRQAKGINVSLQVIGQSQFAMYPFQYWNGPTDFTTERVAAGF